MRQAIGFSLVHFLRRPDEVFPGARTAARAGHNMVHAALPLGTAGGPGTGSGDGRVPERREGGVGCVVTDMFTRVVIEREAA